MTDKAEMTTQPAAEKPTAPAAPPEKKRPGRKPKANLAPVPGAPDRDETTDDLVKEAMDAARLATQRRENAPAVAILQSSGRADRLLVDQYSVKYGGQNKTWHLFFHPSTNLNAATQREGHIVTQHPTSMTLGKPVMMGGCYLMAMPMKRYALEQEAASRVSKSRVNAVPSKASNKYVSGSEFRDSTATVGGKNGQPILVGNEG